MRSILAWCMRGVPFDARSRRAIDETLADWEHEEQEAPSRGRRALATLRGALSVARVASLSLTREAVDFGWCRGLAGRGGLLAGLVLVTAAAQALVMLPALDAQAVPLIPTMVPMTMLALLPPALFLILCWRPVGRAAPAAGAACFLAVVSLVLAGWLVPLSSDLANDLMRRSLGASIGVPGPEDLPPAGAVLFHVTSWGWLTGAVTILAAKLASGSPLRSRWWLAGVPAIYAALIASLPFAIGTSFLVFRTSGAEVESTGQAFALWTAAALVMTAAVAYRREAVPSSGTGHPTRGSS